MASPPENLIGSPNNESPNDTRLNNGTEQWARRTVPHVAQGARGSRGPESGAPSLASSGAAPGSRQRPGSRRPSASAAAADAVSRAPAMWRSLAFMRRNVIHPFDFHHFFSTSLGEGCSFTLEREGWGPSLAAASAPWSSAGAPWSSVKFAHCGASSGRTTPPGGTRQPTIASLA